MILTASFLANTLQKFVAAFVIFATFLYSEAASHGTCRTYNKEPGNCTDIRQCQYLYEILMLYPDISDDITEYLVQSMCSEPNDLETTICCPERLKYLSLNGSYSNDINSGHESDEKVLLEPPNCGLSLTDRIYGGTLTELDEFPWMALLGYMTVYGIKVYYCGGALINSRYVLTAAHCVHEEAIFGYTLIEVRLGEWDTSTDIDCEDQANGKAVCNLPHVDVAVELGIPHPQYNPNSEIAYNDIALVRLAAPVSYTENVQPICVPNPTVFQGKVFTNMIMDVAGWGETEYEYASTVKLKTALRVWSLADCNKVYNTIGYNLNTLQLCAGGERTIDTCVGDSGGPLMGEFTVSGRSFFYVVGIVSYGAYPCGTQGVPGIYTNVVDFWHWIRDTIRN